MIFLNSLFGYLALLILIKWCTGSQADLYHVMIYMFLDPAGDLGENQLFWGQKELQVQLSASFWKRKVILCISNILGVSTYLFSFRYCCYFWLWSLFHGCSSQNLLSWRNFIRRYCDLEIVLGKYIKAIFCTKFSLTTTLLLSAASKFLNKSM